MLTDNDLHRQLPYVLDATDFPFLGARYEGKVRDNYVAGNTRILITTDRISCFDVVITTVPFKGQVLNQLAVSWFSQVEDIIPNHIVDVPDPNVMVVRNCEILPVEVIVRGYITGSAWRDYEAGHPVSGITLPAGLRPSEQLPDALITPSTKAERGAHDQPISEAEILNRGLVDKKLWEQVRSVALALFARGQQQAEKQGLLLVDTKYEFGLCDGTLLLADEIHTLDSSRYWVKESYQRRFEAGESPEMLDKEPVRQWLLERGFKGDGPLPTITDDFRVAISRHYIDSYQKISGTVFEGEVGPVPERIGAHLRKYAATAA